MYNIAYWATNQAWKNLGIVVVLTLCLNHTSGSKDLMKRCSHSQDLLRRIAHSIDFYESNYWAINLDGWLGFVILEDLLKHIPREYPSDTCNVINTVKILHRRLIELNRRGLRWIKTTQRTYFDSVKHVVYRLTMFKSQYRRLNSDYHTITNDGIDSEYNENAGDTCLESIAKGNCTISERCSQMFLSNQSTSRYTATHIVIYLIMYKQSECYSTKKHTLTSTGLEHRINDLCRSILQENTDVLNRGALDITPDVDIIIERILICGGKLGFVDFFSAKALHVIQLSQNTINGCIGSMDYLFNVLDRQNSFKYNSKDTLQAVTKKRSSVMKDGCGSHTIGIGAATLGAFLKYVSSDHLELSQKIITL